MNTQVSWRGNAQWYARLQEALKQAVQEVYEGRWKYSLGGDKGLASDIVELEGEFEIQQIVYAEDQEELVIYARMGEGITTTRQAREVVHRVMGVSDEAYCVLVPLHTPEALQFWFMTGCMSHGHVGRIVIRREENPHMQFDIQLDML